MHHRGLGRALAAAAVLLVAGAAGAGEPRPLSQWVRERWTHRDGLPQILVRRVLASRSGYLWLGTEEGLVRFDGARFKLYERLDEPGLAGNEITALLEDDRGVIWVGTTHGLSRLRGDALERVDLGDDLVVSALASDGDGGVWIGTEGDGLRHVGGVAPRQGAAVGIKVNVLRRGARGALWIGGHDGLARWADGRLDPEPGRGVRGAVWAILEDREGTLWIGTALGLYRRPAGAARAEQVRLPVTEGVSALLEDRQGGLWVGTSTALLRLDRRGGAPLTTEVLEAPYVQDLAEDGEGSVWVGTENGGLQRLRMGQLVTYGQAEGFSTDMVWAVREGRDGAMWVGGDAGLHRIAGGRAAPAHAELLRGDAVTALLEDRSGDLWVATAHGGLLRIGRGGVARYQEAEGINRLLVRVIHQDARGAVWLGTQEGLLRLEGGRFRPFPTADRLRGAAVSVLAEGPDGVLWAGTNADVARVTDGQLVPVEVGGVRLRGDVAALQVDPDGAVWIGFVAEGLARVRGDRITRWTRGEGLHEDTVLAILDDGRGDLWLSGNRGITRVSRAELDEVAAGQRPAVAPAVFGVGDGMRERECNGGTQPAAWRARDGRLWFATIGGAVVVDPATVRENPNAPPVLIEELVVDGRPVPLGGPIVLGPETRRVDIHYTGLALAAADRIRFRHRLEGLDEAFVDAGVERATHYTGLRPGRYQFRVVAANEAGRWGAEEAVLAFEIEPHPWQRPGVQVTLAVLLFALGLTVVHLRTQVHLRRERELAARVEEEMGKVKVLTGMLPVCSWCRRIKDDHGAWHRIEEYVSRRTEARFTHGMCPDCFARFDEENGGGHGSGGGA